MNGLKDLHTIAKDIALLSSHPLRNIISPVWQRHLIRLATSSRPVSNVISPEWQGHRVLSTSIFGEKSKIFGEKFQIFGEKFFIFRQKFLRNGEKSLLNGEKHLSFQRDKVAIQAQ